MVDPPSESPMTSFYAISMVLESSELPSYHVTRMATSSLLRLVGNWSMAIAGASELVSQTTLATRHGLRG